MVTGHGTGQRPAASGVRLAPVELRYSFLVRFVTPASSHACLINRCGRSAFCILILHQDRRAPRRNVPEQRREMHHNSATACHPPTACAPRVDIAILSALHALDERSRRSCMARASQSDSAGSQLGDAVRCGVMRCNAVPCGAVRCGAV